MMIFGKFIPVASKHFFFSGPLFTTSQYEKIFFLHQRCFSFPASLQFSTTAFLQFQSESATAKDLRGFYGNPLMEMQSYLPIPILLDEEICFNPIMQEMKMAEKLFISNKKKQISFVKSVTKIEELPENDLPEVSFYF